MAKITMSSLVHSVSGKLGTLIYSNWKGKRYVRTVPIAIHNPQTDSQNMVRNAFNHLLSLWGGLSLELKAIWQDYAQGLGSANDSDSRIGSRGLISETGKLMTGINAFIGVNLRLLNCGMAITYSPPTETVIGLSSFELVDNFVHSFTLQTTFPAGACAEGDVIRVYLKGVFPGGHSYMATNYSVTAGDITPGEPTTINFSYQTIRVGHCNDYAEAPLVFFVGKMIQAQADLVKLSGAKSTNSSVISINIIDGVEAALEVLYDTASVEFQNNAESFAELVNRPGVSGPEIFSIALRGWAAAETVTWNDVVTAVSLEAIGLMGSPDNIAAFCNSDYLIKIPGYETLTEAW